MTLPKGHDRDKDNGSKYGNNKKSSSKDYDNNANHSDMQIQPALREDELSVRMHAEFHPLLFLVVIPITLSLAFTLLFSYFQVFTIYSISIPESMKDVTLLKGIVFFLTVYMGLIPTVPPIGHYIDIYGRYGGRKKAARRFLESKHPRIQINLYKVLSIILFAAIAAFIVTAVGFTFLTTFISSELAGESTPTWWPLIRNALTGFLVTLFYIIYVILFYLYPSYLKKIFDLLWLRNAWMWLTKNLTKLRK